MSNMLRWYSLLLHTATCGMKIGGGALAVHSDRRTNSLSSQLVCHRMTERPRASHFHSIYIVWWEYVVCVNETA